MKNCDTSCFKSELGQLHLHDMSYTTQHSAKYAPSEQHGNVV